MKLLMPRALWAFLLFVPFVYGAVASQMDVTGLVLGAVAWVAPTALLVISVTISFLVPRYLLNLRLRLKLFAVSEETPRVFANPDRVRTETRSAWFVPFFISVLFSVVPAIEGFVFAFMGASAILWAPFLALGAILVGIRFPSERGILAKAEAAYDARMP